MLVNDLLTVENEELSKVVIFNGMALLHRVNKTEGENVPGFERPFIDKLLERQ